MLERYDRTISSSSSLSLVLFFRCSFATAAAAATISLSSIADAPAVVADRSATVVAAIAAIDPELQAFRNSEHENYDESIGREAIDHSTAAPAATAQRKE